MIDGAVIKAVLGAVLGLPLAAMSVGLLAVVVPMEWQRWVVLMPVLTVLLWSVLIVVAGGARGVARAALGLAAANAALWLFLRTTSLYGSH